MRAGTSFPPLLIIMKYRPATAADNTAFIALYDSLSRKIAYDTMNTAAKQSIRILHDWLFDRKEPVILIESLYTGSATYACYYPLDTDNYRSALPRSGLVRFNMNNLYCNRKQVFTGGIDRRDGSCFLHCTMDLPVTPSEPTEAMNNLRSFMEALARSLCIVYKPETGKGAKST